jgi:SAM-dependent methyltransferase
MVSKTCLYGPGDPTVPRNLMLEATQIPLPPIDFIRLIGSHEPSDFESIGQHVFELIRDRCNLNPTDHVLDIGSGCGRVAIPLSQYLTTGKYDGFDIVEPMVVWCNDNISSRFSNFEFKYANLSNTLYSKDGQNAGNYEFPYADRKFDVAFATSVFTHLMPESASQYAREVARVLKADGRALLTFYILNDESREQLAAGEPIIPFPYHRDGYYLQDDKNPEAVIAFDESVARKLLESANLEIINLSHGFWRKKGGWTYQDAFLVRPKDQA